MSKLYESIGISKQAFYQWKSRLNEKQNTMGLSLDICNEVRKEHPGMGLRTIWEMERPAIGRDQFINQGMLMGLGIKQKRSYRKTTDSRGITKFENKVKDSKLTGVNQIWVSDISYYRVGEKWYYLTLIMDLYSRKIVGYSGSQNLITENTTMEALNYAIAWRLEDENQTPLIMHSDGGGQYYDKEIRRILLANNMESSMAEDVYENSNAERLNRTIKEQYLNYYGIKNFKEFKIGLAKACVMYNKKPHKALNKLSPDEFENKVFHKVNK